MRTAVLFALTATGITASIAAGFASAACAQELSLPPSASRPFHVGAQASTLGFGLEAGYRAHPNIGLRLGGNLFTFSTGREISGIDYDLDIKLRSFGAVVDVYPVASSGFRLTGGARINYNKADLTGRLPAPRSFGGVLVTPAQAGELTGKAEFNRFSPYVGVGYSGTAFSPNFSLGLDLGVLFQGSPRVSLSAPNAPNIPGVAAALENQRREVEDAIRPARFWPVVSITAAYRF